MTQKIRVVLAEDQNMLRGALATVLAIEPDIEVLGSFSDGEQALQAVGKHRPEVLITDIEMPKMTGLELTARVKELYPDTRVLILTTFARPDICGGHWMPEHLPIFSRTAPLKISPTLSGKSVAALVSLIPSWPRRYGARRKTRSPIENA